MPKGANQKLKLYYLSKIMLEKTDDDHMISMPEIQDHLLAYGVEANRKVYKATLNWLKANDLHSVAFPLLGGGHKGYGTENS